METNNNDLDFEVPASAKAGQDKPVKKSKGIKSKDGSFGSFVLLVDTIVIVAMLVVMLMPNSHINLFGTDSKMVGSKATNPTAYAADSYHAVFLSNGQVYFGKITSRDDRDTVLEDIYYLQVSNPLQQVPPPGTQAQPQLSLVKLGNELHGPKDYMTINNDHVLFVEELKQNGKVVEAILNYQENGDAATQ